MAKLYAFLASVMCAVFVLMSSALFLNTKIDKIAEKANQGLDLYTASIVEKLNAEPSIENAKLRHKAYFANCFPNVCGKFSFASLSFTEKSLSEKTGLIEKTTTKYDLGSTAYFVVKYNPITGTVFVEQNANNIILNKNNKKYATAFFNDLNLEISADLIDYYSTLYNGDVKLTSLFDKLLGSISLNVNGFKLSVDDYRFKTDNLNYISDITKNNEEHISLESKLDLKGLLTSQTNITTDSKFDFKIEDLSKLSLIEGFKISNIQADSSYKSISYMQYLLDFVKTLAAENTKFNLSDVDLKLYKKMQNDLLVLSAKGDAGLSLKSDYNPNLNVHFMLKTQDEDIDQLLQEIKFPLRVQQQLVNVFEKDDNSMYHTTIKTQDNKLVVNQSGDVVIDGLVKKYIQTGEVLVSIAKLKMGKANFQ